MVSYNFLNRIMLFNYCPSAIYSFHLMIQPQSDRVSPFTLKLSLFSSANRSKKEVGGMFSGTLFINLVATLITWWLCSNGGNGHLQFFRAETLKGHPKSCYILGKTF